MADTYRKLYQICCQGRTFSFGKQSVAHLSGICCEFAYNGQKDLDNCKIVPRSLVGNCVDSRLRTIDAFSSHDSPLRVRNCTRELGIRYTCTSAYVRIRSRIRKMQKRKRDREVHIQREEEMTRGSGFSLSLTLPFSLSFSHV